MIKSIRHKGLKLFFEKGTTKGIRADHIDRLRDRLTVLDAATCLDDIAAGNWSLHPLTGKLKDQYAIKVSGNWHCSSSSGTAMCTCWTMTITTDGSKNHVHL